jgi:hypothetical protein
VHAPPPFHSIYHHVEGCSVRSMKLQLRGQIHLPYPYFISISMYFVTPGLLLCGSEILTDLEEKENEVTGGQLKPTRAKRQIKGKRAKRQR